MSARLGCPFSPASQQRSLIPALAFTPRKDLFSIPFLYSMSGRSPSEKIPTEGGAKAAKGGSYDNQHFLSLCHRAPGGMDFAYSAATGSRRGNRGGEPGTVTNVLLVCLSAPTIPGHLTHLDLSKSQAYQMRPPRATTLVWRTLVWDTSQLGIIDPPLPGWQAEK